MSSSFSLTNAVTSGDESAVSTLLANGADVNESTNGGQTALILAVVFGHTNLVRTLLQAGADPQLRDNLGLNALDWAHRRGLTEALTLLTNNPASAPRQRIIIPTDQPEESVPESPSTARVNESRENADDGEKSRRWLAGLKQRLDEQADRRINRDEPPIDAPPLREEPVVDAPIETSEEVAVWETYEPVTENKITGAPRILTPPPVEPAKSGKRKRCPQCNAIYNGDLVSYCAHHIVPLVDVDEPVANETPKTNVPMLWVLLIFTLAGSLLAGTIITTYLYRSNQAAPAVPTVQQRTVQKGMPAVGTELAGKVSSLPEAECPVKGSQPVAGTVTVFVMVDKNGQVYRARGAGGDWLMRGCATEAAMKTTFVPDKLRGRDAEGTITYTFKP